jgi:hypothetical protein
MIAAVITVVLWAAVMLVWAVCAYWKGMWD